MNHEQILQQIPDYALGLLPQVERQQVESHAQGCPRCQQALANEQRLGQLVRSTLHAATEPAPRQLRPFMPPIPRRQTPSLLHGWQKQLAPIVLLLMLLLGGMGWNARQQSNGFSNNPMLLVMTATTTNTPTVTATKAPPTQMPTSTAIAISTDDHVATPAPNPTPLALLAYFSN
ncbi:MAG: zf-HC2 domain-containing protein [Anaerolineales bacterium]|nr:zf-HC2 domain-containing protein [Anaerolineales bacterium]